MDWRWSRAEPREPGAGDVRVSLVVANLSRCEAARSYRHSVWRGECLVHDVAGVAGLRGFKHQDLRLRVSDRAMLNTPRHDRELARLQNHTTVAKLNRHLTTPHQEHFVLVLVMMPGKHS